VGFLLTILWGVLTPVLQLPVCWWWCVQSLPIHPSYQPLPLGISECAANIARLWPGKVSTMQTALTTPNAITIPTDQFDAIMAAIAKYVGSAITGRASQRLLDLQGQAVDANAHVDWVNCQP